MRSCRKHDILPARDTLLVNKNLGFPRWVNPPRVKTGFQSARLWFLRGPVPPSDCSRGGPAAALMQKGDFDGVDKAIKAKPDIVHMRSADGQGPLFWSYAAKNKKIRKLLIKNGAQKDVVDKNGKTPKQAKK